MGLHVRTAMKHMFHGTRAETYRYVGLTAGLQRSAVRGCCPGQTLALVAVKSAGGSGYCWRRPQLDHTACTIIATHFAQTTPCMRCMHLTHHFQGCRNLFASQESAKLVCFATCQHVNIPGVQPRSGSAYKRRAPVTCWQSEGRHDGFTLPRCRPLMRRFASSATLTESKCTPSRGACFSSSSKSLIVPRTNSVSEHADVSRVTLPKSFEPAASEERLYSW